MLEGLEGPKVRGSEGLTVRRSSGRTLMTTGRSAALPSSMPNASTAQPPVSFASEEGAGAEDECPMCA